MRYGALRPHGAAAWGRREEGAGEVSDRRGFGTDRSLLITRRLLAQAALDGACWGVAITIAAFLRVDFEVGKLSTGGQVAMALIACAVQALTGSLFGLYTGRWRFGSFDEVAGLAKSVVAATFLLFAIDAALPVDPRLVPLSAVVGGGIAALVLMSGVRYAFRLVMERRRRPSGEGLQALVVFGAGEGGVQAITAMLRNPASPFLPVAILDDDPRKRNLSISGVPVVGTRENLVEAAGAFDASTVLVAIPSAERELLADITDRANSAGLVVKVLPSVSDLDDSGDGVEVSDIRDIAPADLLGRHEVDTDLAAIASYLRGRRVLVTGAGGSIGSELCRQIATFEPAELIMLDRDESALHAVKLSISGSALMNTRDVVLADIREASVVREIFTDRRPQVVFHAAALKHLPMLEQYPEEGYKTNVLGTLHVLEAAEAVGVERFVNVSTDKAADPTSVLGYTKRIAERLTAHVATRAEGIYLSVRFGNVLGSRGSVLDAFTAQIEAGGPVTVTHPEITRYFMTTGEAVQLVIQAGAIGRDGEVLVLDMGTPVKIADVARQLVAQSGKDIEIVFTGLRPAEKMHETLFGDGERDERPFHPLIAHCDVPPITATEANGLLGTVEELMGCATASGVSAR